MMHALRELLTIIIAFKLKMSGGMSKNCTMHTKASSKAQWTLACEAWMLISATDKAKAEILDWLEIAKPYLNYTLSRQKCHENTGRWFLDSKEFGDWYHRPRALLWIYGIRKQ